MPIDNDSLAIFNTAMASMDNAVNVSAAASMNKKTRKWNEGMYERQRQDAKSDWEMQNEYNHPSSQMARLREAGLNPNLVYGKGADNTASMVRSSSPGQWSPKAPVSQQGQVLSQGLMSYYDLKMKQAQIDNLRVQNTVLDQDRMLKLAQTLSVAKGTDKTGLEIETGMFDLALKNDLRETSLEMAKGQVGKLKADTDYVLNQTETAALMRAPNLTKAGEEILNLRLSRAKTDAEIRHIRQQVENLRNGNVLQDLDIQLKRLGIQPSDNIAARMLGRILGSSDSDGGVLSPKGVEATRKGTPLFNPGLDILQFLKR